VFFGTLMHPMNEKFPNGAGQTTKV